MSTTDIDVQSITLNKTSVAGVKDTTIQMEASVYPENATEQEVDWYTDDMSIATVSDKGELKILKKGTTKLRAYSRDGNCVAECDVQGVSEFDESKLQISSPYLFLNENEQDMLFAYYGDADVSCKWTSANEEVATVDETGLVTAKKEGYGLIIATMEDGTQVSCMTIVSKAKSDEPENATPTPTVTPIVTPEPTQNSEAAATTKPQATKKPSSNNSSASMLTHVKKVKNVKVKKAGKKKLLVTWQWVLVRDGYEVQYALNKSFTKAKKTKKCSWWLEKTKLKGLKSKKSYYVRIRAYVKNGSQKQYGKWSTVKKCKVK